MIQIRTTDNTKEAKAFVRYILTLPFVEVINVPNKETTQALQDAVNENTTAYNSTDELFDKILKDAKIQEKKLKKIL